MPVLLELATVIRTLDELEAKRARAKDDELNEILDKLDEVRRELREFRMRATPAEKAIIDFRVKITNELGEQIRANAREVAPVAAVRITPTPPVKPVPNLGAQKFKEGYERARENAEDSEKEQSPQKEPPKPSPKT